MLQKSQSKKIWQLKYLLLVPMVLGMLMYTSSAQEAENSNAEPLTEQQIGDEALIRQINNWIDEEENLDILLIERELIKKEQDRNYVFTKKEYFKMNLLTRRALEITFSGNASIRTEKSQSLNQMPLPSTAAYLGYVSRKKAFQILDKNLKMSINQKELSIRKIEKEDKNLGPGEFVKVADVSDLTGDEIRNFNRTLARIDFNNSFLFLSDDEHAFLISKAEKQGNDTPKSNSNLEELKELEDSNTAAKQYNILLKQRNRLLKNSTQNSAIIKNLDEELLKLKKSTQNGEQTANRGAQNNQIHVPFGTVDEVPIFPGCEDAENQKDCFLERMQEHIRKNFKYPIGAQEQGIQGRVSIMFTIDEQGAIEKIRKRGPDKLLEQEAVRIISLLPKMTPGKHKGEVVKVPFSIPITFKMDSSNDFELQEIKSNLDGEALRLTKKYNELVQERNSLDTKDEKIKDLEEKLFILKVQLKEIMNKVDQEITGVPFTEVDEVPIFPGCENSSDKRECFKKAIQKHVNDNFSYPKEAQKKAIQGRVSVLFYIEPDGVVRKILKRGPDVLLENEAERIMKLLPQMQPGKHKGKAVRVPFSIPITFILN